MLYQHLPKLFVKAAEIILPAMKLSDDGSSKTVLANLSADHYPKQFETICQASQDLVQESPRQVHFCDKSMGIKNRHRIDMSFSNCGYVLEFECDWYKGIETDGRLRFEKFYPRSTFPDYINYINVGPKFYRMHLHYMEAEKRYENFKRLKTLKSRRKELYPILEEPLNTLKGMLRGPSGIVFDYFGLSICGDVYFKGAGIEVEYPGFKGWIGVGEKHKTNRRFTTVQFEEADLELIVGRADQIAAKTGELLDGIKWPEFAKETWEIESLELRKMLEFV